MEVNQMLLYLERVFPLQQLIVEQLSVFNGIAQLALQTIDLFWAKHRIHQVSLHMQDTQAHLELNTFLQQTLE